MQKTTGARQEREPAFRGKRTEKAMLWPLGIVQQGLEAFVKIALVCLIGKNLASNKNGQPRQRTRLQRGHGIFLRADAAKHQGKLAR